MVVSDEGHGDGDDGGDDGDGKLTMTEVKE